MIKLELLGPVSGSVSSWEYIYICYGSGYLTTFWSSFIILILIAFGYILDVGLDFEVAFDVAFEVATTCDGTLGLEEVLDLALSRKA